MKKILLIVFSLVIGHQSFAQFNQGRILAGGSVGFSTNTSKSRTGSTTVKNSTSTSISLSPDVGYFLIDNLAVGASLLASSATYKGAGNNSYTSTFSSISLNPFARYYLDPGIFFEGQFGFGTTKSKTKQQNVTTDTKQSGSNWSIGAGYAYFLNDNVALEPFLGYRSNTSKNGNNKDINNGLFLNVGLQVYLGARN